MEFLRIVAPWYLMIVVKLMTDGIIRGAGAMTYFVAATVPDLIIRILFALIFSRNYGSTGIWMAWPFGWIAATVLTLVFYRKVRRQSGDLAWKNEHITIFRGYLSFMNCTEYFCSCSGNIENISMTGVRLVQYTGLRQTVSGLINYKSTDKFQWFFTGNQQRGIQICSAGFSS